MHENIPTRDKYLDEKFCSDCGSIIKIKSEICPKCGVRQINYSLFNVLPQDILYMVKKVKRSLPY